MSDHVESYKQFRPTTLAEMVGQPQAVKVIRELLAKNQFPHAFLLSGPSGTGKTTLARIIKEELSCADVDYHEINAADDRGIEMVRDVRSHINQAPLAGKVKIWYLDEAHQASKRQGGDAQTAMLKMLEDTPKHVYFILATTDPQQLLSTIRNRCTEVKLKLINDECLSDLVRQVIVKGDYGQFSKEVVVKISECAEGSARKALSLLDSVRHLPDDERSEALERSDVVAQAIDLCRQLMNPKSAWSNVVRVLGKLDDEPEAVRRAVLGYATKVLLGGGKLEARAYAIIVAFENNFFDSGKSGLVRACYEVYKDR